MRYYVLIVINRQIVHLYDKKGPWWSWKDIMPVVSLFLVVYMFYLFVMEDLDAIILFQKIILLPAAFSTFWVKGSFFWLGDILYIWSIMNIVFYKLSFVECGLVKALWLDLNLSNEHLWKRLNTCRQILALHFPALSRFTLKSSPGSEFFGHLLLEELEQFVFSC